MQKFDVLFKRNLFIKVAVADCSDFILIDMY